MQKGAGAWLQAAVNSGSPRPSASPGPRVTAGTGRVAPQAPI